jgi:cbb3-type cytochrome oxidase maturation protein
MFELTLVQVLVALFMSLAALSLFIWAALSGLFTNVEDIAYRALRAEVQDDEFADRGDDSTEKADG